MAIVGGGSTGLAALKHLSDLGKQAVLIEAGPQVGTKNVSGGILYSKRPRNGKVHNVEDVYGSDFEASAPSNDILLNTYFMQPRRTRFLHWTLLLLTNIRQTLDIQYY